METSLIESIKDNFFKDPKCPKCHSKKIVKAGFFKGKQRYKCNCCKKTFNIFTGTILSYSHYKEKWDDFIQTMEDKKSLRKAAIKLKVDNSTLFYWRHKIMSAINKENTSILTGPIELGFMMFPYIDKNYKEGAQHLDLSNNKVIFTGIYKIHRKLEFYIIPSPRDVNNFVVNLKDRLDRDSRICLGGDNAFFKMPLGWNKIKVIYKVGENVFIKNENVKKFIRKFKYWLRTFRGVSTKNLIKYGDYFKENEINKNFIKKLLSRYGEKGFIRNEEAVIGAF